MFDTVQRRWILITGASRELGLQDVDGKPLPKGAPKTKPDLLGL